ncbi:MAG: hypothetical protein HUK02_10070, partial [Bacteroidaceae bacterium]|nr:hypothetical protein [Bacteroidaceae bacterium]
MRKILLLLMICFISQNSNAINYKGFVEAGYGFGVGKYWGDTKQGRVALFTSHGIEINPYIFVGTGVGIEVATHNPVYFNMVIPIFVDMRLKLPLKASPYFDLRIGDMIGVGDSNHGLYLCPSVGYRFEIGKNKGLNLG